MIDNVLRTDEAAPRPKNAAASQIAVLAGLAALGTLATNILLPSLPQMAEALRVSSATVTSAITVFLAVFALGQLSWDQSQIAMGDAGRSSPVLPCSWRAAFGAQAPARLRAF